MSDKTKKNKKTKPRAPRNRTLTCTTHEISSLSPELLTLNKSTDAKTLKNRIINQEIQKALPFLPRAFVDLLILDPPYNLTKNFNGNIFHSREADKYTAWLEGILSSLLPLLRPTASD